MIEQIKAELPVYLANRAKSRKKEELPKNYLATAVARALTAASRMICFQFFFFFFFFFFLFFFLPLNTSFRRATRCCISRLSVSYAFNITAKLCMTIYVLHYRYYSLWNNHSICWNNEQLYRNNGRKHREQKNRIISTFINIIL